MGDPASKPICLDSIFCSAPSSLAKFTRKYFLIPRSHRVFVGSRNPGMCRNKLGVCVEIWGIYMITLMDLWGWGGIRRPPPYVHAGRPTPPRRRLVDGLPLLHGIPRGSRESSFCCPSVCMPICLFVCLCVLYVCLSACLYACMCLCACLGVIGVQDPLLMRELVSSKQLCNHALMVERVLQHIQTM